MVAADRIIIVEDYRTYKRRLSAWVRAGLIGVISAPVRIAGTVTGAVAAFSFSEGRRFGEKDIVDHFRG